jgi:hypothetical protein
VKREQGVLADPAIEEKQRELLAVRHKHFSARKAAEKTFLRKQDVALSKELAALLGKDGFCNSTDAQKMADWNPYDQTQAVDFFDAYWMIGIKDGFDVVIGNPPYVDSEMMVNIGLSELRDYIRSNYDFAKGNWDIYIAFFEKGFKLLRKDAVLTFITPDKWLTKPFGEELRKNKLKNLETLFKSGRNVFESVGVDSIVTVFGKENDCFQFLTSLKTEDYIFVNKDIFYAPYQLDIVFSKYFNLLMKISQNNKPLSSLDCICENACATSDAYLLKDIIKDNNKDNFNKEQNYKMINTGTIGKYTSRWGLKKMKYLGNDYYFPIVNKKHFHTLFPKSYGQKAGKSKIIIKGLTLLDGTLDIDGEYIPGKTTILLISENRNTLKLLSAIINSKFAQFYITERYSASSYNGGVTFTKDMLLNLPVPDVFQLRDSPSGKIINQLVDKILAAKAADPQADTSALEREIDNLVYRLYGLTEDEIRVVEGKNNEKN